MILVHLVAVKKKFDKCLFIELNDAIFMFTANIFNYTSKWKCPLCNGYRRRK